MTSPPCLLLRCACATRAHAMPLEDTYRDLLASNVPPTTSARLPRPFVSSRRTARPRRVVARSESAQHAVADKSGRTAAGGSRRELLAATVSGVAASQLTLAERTEAQEALYRTIDPVETVELGRTGLRVCAGGVGAWSWGDRSGYWGYNDAYTRTDNEAAYKAVAERGIALIDTAEAYGFGLSEEILGAAIRTEGVQPFIATKFAPLPWRFTSGSVEKALRGSLERLSLPQIGLYQIHWPGFLTQGYSNDAFVRGLAQCCQKGLTQAVGISNFRADRVRTAASILEMKHRVQGEGQQLASNQVQYSLLYRVPETNGVIEAMRESGATLIAYSPLCQGLLTGKYNETNLPTGPRSAFITKERVKEVEPLLDVMRQISGKRDKTLAQIAINWTLCKGALPIPGAKNAKQVNETAGAFGWRLTGDEVQALDDESSRLKPSLANPVENF